MSLLKPLLMPICWMSSHVFETEIVEQFGYTVEDGPTHYVGRHKCGYCQRCGAVNPEFKAAMRGAVR